MSFACNCIISNANSYIIVHEFVDLLREYFVANDKMERSNAVTLLNVVEGVMRLNDGVRLHRETPLTPEEAGRMDQELLVQQANVDALERRYRMLRAAGSGIVSDDQLELVCSLRDLLADLELQIHISRILHAVSLPGVIGHSTNFLLNYNRSRPSR